MNIDPNLIAAAVDGWKVAAAGLAIALASGFLGHKLGRRPNAERERMLRERCSLLTTIANDNHAEWVKTTRLWNAAKGEAFDEATAANKLRGELEDARAHIMSLSIDIADLITKNHRDHDPKTGHFLPTHRTRPDVAASLKATADETRPSRVSSGAACAHGA